MKVISKRKDYYDGFLDYSKEKQTTWKREYQVTPFNRYEEIPVFQGLYEKIKRLTFDKKLASSKNHDGFYQIYNGFICFAGKFYPFVKVMDYSKSPFSFEQKTFYDEESLNKYLSKLSVKDKDFLNEENESRFLSFSDPYRNATLAEKIKAFFEKNDVMSFDELNKIHLHFDTPVFIYDQHFNEKIYSDNIIKNKSNKFEFFISSGNFLLHTGDLSDYDFVKVFLPQIFVQELEMYMSNIFIEKDPIENFSDNVKINSHGFDDKVSFRTRKKG